MPGVSGLKNGKVEFDWLAEPGGVFGVISQIVTGAAMNQNRQSIAVTVQPRDELIELRRVKCELTAPARVRPDRFLVEPPD